MRLPVRFNADTMYPFMARALHQGVPERTTTVEFDFRSLDFIEPVGVVVLSNLIERLRRSGVEVKFAYSRIRTAATTYLDSAGFFKHYLGERNFEHSTARSTTMPLMVIQGDRVTEYLYFQLMPWISEAVSRSRQSLDPLRVSLEEIFHNVRDHSGVDFGCAFAQHFPNQSRLQVAIADFGHGIPDVVRRKCPGADDVEAMRLACQEGFTTQSTVGNRGAGLPILTRYVTQRNGGTVLIAANGAQMSATLSEVRETKLTARSSRGGFFPGTLVRVVLRTDTLEHLEEDVEPEDFEW